MSETIFGLWGDEIDDLTVTEVYGKVRKDLKMRLDTYLYEMTADFEDGNNEEIAVRIAQLQYLLGED